MNFQKRICVWMVKELALSEREDGEQKKEKKISCQRHARESGESDGIGVCILEKKYILQWWNPNKNLQGETGNDLYYMEVTPLTL